MDYAGKRLDGRYLIEQLIGEGGMADVYKGVDLLENRPVAVKILREELNGNAELVRRFTNESRAISVLNHQGIVKVYDVSVDDKLHYIVMELVKGITLKEYIEQRGEPLTYKEVVHFTSQVLHALQHAHDKGIIHRDIKPQNIMILEDGGIKVMDFGIARLARSEIHTAEEQAIGSVHYISPEQAQGIETDLRADIYSVGIMMYEMLSGTLPFEDDNAVAIAVKQISDEAVPLTQANPSVPQGLADISMRAMSKDPRKRYQSALEMLRDIEEFKRNPSIKFEYDYLTEDDPSKYIGSIMGTEKANGNGSRPAAKNMAGKKARRKDNRERNKRRRRIGMLVPIILGITFALCGASALYAWDLLQNSANPLFGEYEEIDLPNFTTMQYEEVLEMTKKSPYNYLRFEVKEETNNNYTEGVVITQNPTSDTDRPKKVKANQMVHLTVSKGISTVEIPSVSGLSRHDAIQAILDVGLMPYAKAVRADDTTPGIALGTQPEEGTPVKNEPGFMVTILISSRIGDYERVVPNLVGLENTEQAQQLLETRDLQIGQIKEEDSTEPAGKILRQSPEPGTTVTVGGDVTVWISRETPVVEETPTEASSSSSSSSSGGGGNSSSSSSSTSETSSESESESSSESTSESPSTDTGGDNEEEGGTTAIRRRDGSNGNNGNNGRGGQ